MTLTHKIFITVSDIKIIIINKPILVILVNYLLFGRLYS